jgi:hypothetical protein
METQHLRDQHSLTVAAFSIANNHLIKLRETLQPYADFQLQVMYSERNGLVVWCDGTGMHVNNFISLVDRYEIVSKTTFENNAYI